MRTSRTIPALAALAAFALALAGCATSADEAAITPSSAAPSAPAASPADGTPAPSADASESPSPAPAWAMGALTSEADCAAFSDLIAPGVTGSLVDIEDKAVFPLRRALEAVAATPSTGCDWEVDAQAGSYMHDRFLYLGRTADGSAIDPSAFDVFRGSAEGQAIETPYESEPEGAGTMYFVDGTCGEKSLCGICHYVEGDLIATHVRPQDGECRSTLREVLADLKR